MLKTPRRLDRNARGVGMHVLKTEDMVRRNGFVGVQWSGRLEAQMIADTEDMSRGVGTVATVRDAMNFQILAGMPL